MSEFPPDLLTEQWVAGLSGDANAYEAALRGLTRVLRSYLRSRLPLFRGVSEEVTEDLVQDVMIAIHSKRHTYRAGHSVMPWAYAITKHRLIDYLRMMKVRPRTRSMFDEELGWEAIEGKLSIEREAEREEKETARESREALLELLDELSPVQREVLRMAKLEDRSLREIADTLSLSLANVKVTVHRSVKKLQAAQARKK